MKKYIIFAYFIMITLCGCGLKAPRRVKEAFTDPKHCFLNSINANDSDKIRTDGFYQMRSSYCIFYSNGLWIESFRNDTWESKKNISLIANIYGIDKWGVYRVEGDTVKIRYLYTVQRAHTTWDCWYLIKNQEEINLLVNTPTTKPITEWMLQLEQRKFPNGQWFTFVQKDTLPDMNLSEFKRSKWLWCDKEAYEKWKAGQQK